MRLLLAHALFMRHNAASQGLLKPTLATEVMAALLEELVLASDR